MVDYSITGEQATITFETQAKYIKAVELICETLKMDLEEYLSLCVYHGVNCDLGNEFEIMTQSLRFSLSKQVHEMRARSSRDFRL